MEGFEIGQCPHQANSVAGPEPGVTEVEDVEILSTPVQSDLLIGRADVLSINEATEVLRSRVSRVIAVVGPISSGKTTLCLSLYDAFQHQPFDRWSFAGSLTLSAFEQRCYLSRADSGRITPDTPRTSGSDGLGFLHLAVHSEDTGRTDILIPDRSGEFYSAVANSEETCDSLHEVYRADHVLFLVDGKRLCSDERHGVKSDILMMIASLTEGGVLRSGQSVAILLTKYDIVKSSGFAVRAEKDFADLVEGIRLRFVSTLSDVKAFKVAARSEDDLVEQRLGVLDVLEEVLRPKNRTPHISSAVLPPHRSFLRLTVIDGGAA